MHARTTAALAAAGIVLATGLACGLGNEQPQQQGPGFVQTEDCDAEDYRNMEADCGFTQADRDRAKRASLKPAPRLSTKPIPKTTRRR